MKLTVLNEKLMEILNVLVYSAAVFGAGMLFAYIICALTQERDYIPMQAIEQWLTYVGALTLGTIIFLTDVFFERMGNVARFAGFGAVIYIVGMTLFQLTAPHPPFSGIKYFIGFSYFYIGMIGIFYLGWIVYQGITNRKYSACLNNYKSNIH